MTGREATSFLPCDGAGTDDEARPWSERLAVIGFGAIQWPWLLRSLWGGTRSAKAALLKRLALPATALPKLGSWKADTQFLKHIVDAIERHRPSHVVELGAGATTLVAARALELHGGGALHSYDQHRPFTIAVNEWLADHGMSANLHYAPLVRGESGWPGPWYRLDHLPDRIDMLIIDGPSWTLHPLVRGSAERLFDRIASGGIVLLDDAARPGERIITARWRKRWPDFDFAYRAGIAGTLIGTRRKG